MKSECTALEQRSPADAGGGGGAGQRHVDALAGLRDSEARLRSLAELSSDWYWEQDSEFRFTLRSGGMPEHAALRPDGDHGKAHWELPIFGVSEAQWTAHRAVLEAHEPFRDFVYQRRDRAGQVRHVCVSGHPVFDDLGRFCGYRGIGRDITETRRQEQLLVLEHAVARCLADAEDAAAALRAVLQAVCETENWEHGAYWRADDAAGRMHLGEVWHVPGEQLAQYTLNSRDVAFAPGIGLVGTVWQSGEPLWVADFGTDPRVLQKTLAREISLRGMFVFAVKSVGKTLGVFAFFSREVREPDQRLLAAARVIGSQVGQFLHRKHREEALRDSEARLRSLCELSSDWYWEQDADLRFTVMSGGFQNKGNFRVARALGLRRWELPVEHAGTNWTAHRAMLDAHLPFTDFEYRIRTEDGGIRHYSARGEPLFNADGIFRGYRGVTNDVTKRKQAEETIGRHAMQQSLIAAFGQKALANTDIDELLVQVADVAAQGLNVAFSLVLQLAGDARALLLRAGRGWDGGWQGRRIAELGDSASGSAVLTGSEPLMVDDLQAAGASAAPALLAAHAIRSSVCVPIHGVAGPYGALGACAAEPGRFAQDSIHFLKSLANTLATAMDRRGAEQRLTYLAQFDALTGLPNRSLFLDRFVQALKQAQRNGWLVGVLFIDLDRFKVVNDTLGHSSGDALLVQVAARLQECVRADDAVGRLGGDEFGFVLSNLARPDDAALVAQKVVGALARPFMLDGEEIYVSASIGIGVYPSDGDDADTLLRNADTAMFRAKELGRNGYQFYLPQMNELALERLQLQTQLRGALERREFVLHYQPKACLASGRISGFEALLRWQHPVRGLVPPLQFIGILEETGLIIAVGEWVVRTVCEQLAAWQAAGITPRPVAINLSARQFQQRNLDAKIAAIVAESGIDPGLLELELTESMLMSDPDEAVRMLNTMRGHGVRLSVDDFGTGYSSLAYLKRFPLDALKIDRVFIRDVTTDADDASIALAIISLAHNLKLKVVAEGVETADQLAFLTGHGCDEIQGYYFAKPLAIADCTRALLDDRRLPQIQTPPDL